MKEFFSDKGTIRILVLFLIVNGLLIVFRSRLIDMQIDPDVVVVGNVILLLSSFLTLFLYGKAKKSKTTHGFTKNVYAAFVIKFFILITAVMFYFYFAREINIRAVFVCMGLYLVYHFVGASYAARVVHKTAKHPK